MCDPPGIRAYGSQRSRTPDSPSSRQLKRVFKTNEAQGWNDLINQGDHVPRRQAVMRQTLMLLIVLGVALSDAARSRPGQCAAELARALSEVERQQDALALPPPPHTRRRPHISHWRPRHDLERPLAGAVLVSPPPSPWCDAAAVAVDNTDAAAKDVPGCGTGGGAPCLTIRYGVSRALANATVTVRGGGRPYLDECGSGMQQQTPGSSLTVQGVSGLVTIDCERKGRAFRFNASGTAATALMPGAGATLRLVGLEVHNGVAPATGGDDGKGGALWAQGCGSLEVDNCTFVNCTATHGGAIFAHDVRIRMQGSRFLRCTATPSAGGGMLAEFAASLVSLTAVSIANCEFIDTHSDYGGGGVYVGFLTSCAVTDTIVSVCGSSFTRSTAGGIYGAGGGLDVCYFGGPDEGAVTHVDDCSFDRTGASNMGGGLQVYHNLHANRPVTRVQRCSFSKATAAQGGGAGISYYGGASGAITLVSACQFTDNSAGAIGGGGLYLNFDATSSDTDTSIAGCTFRNAKGFFYGGGIFLSYGGATSNVLTGITGTTFASCQAGTYGGGGAVISLAGPTHMNPVVFVDGSHFENNTVSGDGSGGGLLVQTEGVVTNATITVQSSFFGGNSASGIKGGGGLQVQMVEDEPQNLRFVGANDSSLWRNQSSGTDRLGFDDDQFRPFYPYPLPPDLNNPCSGCGAYPNGCSTCPEFQPYGEIVFPVQPPGLTFRRWSSSNTIHLCDSRFSANTAAFQGGAIAIPDGGNVTIESTVIEDNGASALFGGGVSVGGTVLLAVRNSTLRRNNCGQRGCQLHSSSGAGIRFDGNSVIELGCSAQGGCKAGFSAVQVGNVTWSAGSALACPAGFQLLNSSALAYSITLDDWKLEPPSVFPPGCKLDAAAALGNTPFNSTCRMVETKSNCPCFFSANPYGGHFSEGFGRATLFPSVLVSTLSYRCSACPRDTFNPIPPVLGAADDSIIGTCQECPYGSSCSAGTMVATRNMWGVNGSSTGGELGAFRCPARYCCDREPCGSIDGCVGNRGGVLCGSCAPGHVQTIGSAVCRHFSECGGGDADWFVPGVLLLAVVFALYARKSGAGGSEGWPMNAVQPMLYFYQMMRMIPVGNTAGAILALLSSVFNMQISAGGGGGFACPFKSLTTLQAIELQYAVPAVVAVMLALGFGVEARQWRSSGGKVRLSGGGGGPWLDYQIAVLKATSLAFSTLLSTTFELLHCVDLRPAAGSSVLFRTATTECGAWQVPLFVLAAALLLPVVAGLSAGARVGAACTTRLALPAAASAKMRAPFRPDCGHWEAALALHRLAVVVVFCFISSGESAVAAVLQTLVCGIALAVQLVYRPYAEDSANHTQASLLTLLVVVALLNVPQAVVDTNATAESAHASVLLKQLRDATAVLALVPAVVMGTALPLMLWRQRAVCATRIRAACLDLAGSEIGKGALLDEPLLPSAGAAQTREQGQPRE